jgi:hypothetical protein
MARGSREPTVGVGGRGGVQDRLLCETLSDVKDEWCRVS